MPFNDSFCEESLPFFSGELGGIRETLAAIQRNSRPKRIENGDGKSTIIPASQGILQSLYRQLPDEYLDLMGDLMLAKKTWAVYGISYGELMAMDEYTREMIAISLGG